MKSPNWLVKEDKYQVSMYEKKIMTDYEIVKSTYGSIHSHGIRVGTDLCSNKFGDQCGGADEYEHDHCDISYGDEFAIVDNDIIVNRGHVFMLSPVIIN